MNGTSTRPEAGNQGNAPNGADESSEVPKRPPATDYRYQYESNEGLFRQVGIATLILGLILVIWGKPAEWPTRIAAFQLFFIMAPLMVYSYHRRIRALCSNCGGSVPHDVAWVCGTCKTVNNGKRFSFLNRCANPNCTAMPKVLFCPQCSTPIFLEGKPAAKPYAFLEGKTNPATQADALGKQEKAREQAEREAAKRKRAERRVETVEEIEFKTKLARSLTNKLKAEMELWETQQQFASAKERRTTPKQTEKERLQSNLERKKQKFLLVKIVAEEERRVAAVEFKDNPELLRAAYDVINEFVQEEIR